jgi:hypothetical protein
VPQITGFDGHPWGTWRETIVVTRDTPMEEVAETGGVVRLRYRDSIAGLPAFVDYYIDLFQFGLIGGVFNVDAPTPGTCASTFSTLHRSIEARYPDLPGKRVGSEGVAGFCGGPEGSFTGYGWKDPVNGAEVVLGRVGGDRWIAVGYRTPEMRGWEAARDAHESRSRF